jgi:peptidoglycan/LPS O-acetylase OafA/YrhL
MSSPPAFVRNQGLDILRGVAILLVLVNHVEPSVLPGLPELSGAAGAVYWRLRSLGWSGVDMFFVLSGFLISGLLFKELERTGSLALGRFWGRRAFKILPSYAVLLAVLAWAGATHWLDTSSPSMVLSSLIQHGLFVQNYLEHNPNGPTWSLAVEEHFYLLLPGLLLMLWRSASVAQFERRVLTVGVVVMAVVLAGRCLHAWQAGVHTEDYRLSHFRIDSLFLGVLVQLLARRKHGLALAVIKHPWRALAVAAMLIAPSFFMGRSHPVMFSVGFTGLGLGYALVVLVFAHGFDFRHPSLPGRVLAQIGTWSYNIYLWNFFLTGLPLGGYALAQAWLATGIADPMLEVVARGTLFIIVSVAVGAAFTWLVENPFLWLRDVVLPASRRAHSPATAMPAAATKA